MFTFLNFHKKTNATAEKQYEPEANFQCHSRTAYDQYLLEIRRTRVIYMNVEGYEGTTTGRHVTCNPCLPCFDRIAFCHSGLAPVRTCMHSSSTMTTTTTTMMITNFDDRPHRRGRIFHGGEVNV